MSQQPNLQGLFERPTTLPDPDAQGRLARLVGMDDKIKRLANVLGVLINPAGLRKWQDKHHADAGGAVPLRVAGVGVVAVVTVSGLTQAEDHAMVCRALAEFLARPE